MSLREKIAQEHYVPAGKGLALGLWPLLPLEVGYRLAVALRDWAFSYGPLSSERSPVPLISVGNLSTGGTGKTPVVIALAQTLLSMGQRVLILSRGYGAEIPQTYARATDARYGDEAFLIQQALPEAIVIVGKDRKRNLARVLQVYQPDWVLLDDGFQYRKLTPHLNIVLIDGERLFGNGHLLPAGPLREPIAALKRADAVLLTKSIPIASLQTLEACLASASIARDRPPYLGLLPFQPLGLTALADAEHLHAFKHFQDRAVIALSGLAQPERFEQDLKDQGLNLVQHFRFPDHHVYTAEDLRPVWAALRHWDAQDPLLLTTDKDRVKLDALIPVECREQVYTLQVQPDFDFTGFLSSFFPELLPAQAALTDGGEVEP